MKKQIFFYLIAIWLIIITSQIPSLGVLYKFWIMWFISLLVMWNKNIFKTVTFISLFSVLLWISYLWLGKVYFLITSLIFVFISFSLRILEYIIEEKFPEVSWVDNNYEKDDYMNSEEYLKDEETIGGDVEENEEKNIEDMDYLEKDGDDELDLLSSSENEASKKEWEDEFFDDLFWKMWDNSEQKDKNDFEENECKFNPSKWEIPKWLNKNPLNIISTNEVNYVLNKEIFEDLG